jgi:hypothetical protein
LFAHSLDLLPRFLEEFVCLGDTTVPHYPKSDRRQPPMGSLDVPLSMEEGNCLLEMQPALGKLALGSKVGQELSLVAFDTCDRPEVSCVSEDASCDA